MAEDRYSTVDVNSRMRNRYLYGQETGIRSMGVSSDIPSGESGCHPNQKMEDASSLMGKRMAVVLFSNFPGDPRPRRAAETFAQAGMAVEVICLMDEGSLRQETFKGIEIERVAIKKVRNSKYWYLIQYGLFILVAFSKLAARSVSRRYHMVHIHNMPDVLVMAALVPKLLGAKVILDLHDPMPELMMTIFNVRRGSRTVWLMAMFERWSIAFADVVLTVNRACEKLFASRSCAQDKICVVMNTPDETIFRYSPAKLSSGPSSRDRIPFVIMYHGTLVERNGVDLAVDALAEVRRVVPEAELRIYGPKTPFLDRVMESVSEKKLEKAVQYLGPRRLEQLVEAIAGCDVGVIPNKRNIFTEINTPTRIFEYLALGKPVVAPRAPGIQDYFNEDALIYFDLGNVDDLARALVWTARNPDKVLERMKQGQAVYRMHSWQIEQAKLLAVGKRLISSCSLVQ